MTLNELRYIVAVANERSFGRAAQRCFVSQPALSVAIQKLEEELGARLFERGKAEVTVTPVGERIVEQAQKVLEEAARIKELAQAGRNQLAGYAEARRDLHGRAVSAARPHSGAARPRAADAARNRGGPDREPRGGAEKRPHRRGDRRAALRAAGNRRRIPVRGAVPDRRAARPQMGAAEIGPRRTNSPRSARSCSASAIASATRCSTPARSSTARESPVTRTNSLETVRNMVASGLGVSVLPRDAMTPKYHSKLVVPVPFTRPAPVAPHRARLAEELSAAAGDPRDPRRGRRVPDATRREGVTRRPARTAKIALRRHDPQATRFVRHNFEIRVPPQVSSRPAGALAKRGLMGSAYASCSTGQRQRPTGRHPTRCGAGACTKKEGLHLRVTPWFMWWAVLVSNQWPLPCEGSALPLS